MKHICPSRITLAESTRETVSLPRLAMLSTHCFRLEQETLRHSHYMIRCLVQGSHFSREQFLPEPRFEPTTSGYKSNTLSTRATTAPVIHVFITVGQILKRNWNENIFETWCLGALRSLRILRIAKIGSGYDKFVTPCVTQQKFQYFRLIQLTEMPIHYITTTQNIQFTWASTAHVLEPPH